ncbi:kinesin-like protein KIN-5A isoform X2 [Apium graveolens]|uniref:kinesin-like protein KIN-5A isoform X2 n=1 Tax=Apium graveolens TaxID=4045 RepID=UPI003D7A5AC7
MKLDLIKHQIEFQIGSSIQQVSKDKSMLAMTEKIERMELDFESRDKQFMELQGLHNSQLQLTSELSDKLEKTEVY